MNLETKREATEARALLRKKAERRRSMEMAERAGVNGILVLSGEATMEDLEGAPQIPSLVVGSVDELAR